MLRWFPWRFLLRHAARRHGFLDPFSLIARLEKFAQPAEVAAPLELVRAGAIFHARGLVNSQAIQHNLDWIWPYWVECQFNPHDKAFLPRAFSVTHVNLTHRNWTAVGEPDSHELPLVDPRGLVIPLYDGWSIDAWVIEREGHDLIPSRLKTAEQSMQFDPYAIITTAKNECSSLDSSVHLKRKKQHKECVISYKAQSTKPAFLVISVRPYNVEGISFIDSLKLGETRDELLVNDEHRVSVSCVPTIVRMSTYNKGDVAQKIKEEIESGTIGEDDDLKVKCNVGMATAAMIYELPVQQPFDLTVTISLKWKKDHAKEAARLPGDEKELWQEVVSQTARLEIPDKKMQFLYDAAVRSLILHSYKDVYPGPYTYKRFWFRDAAFILNTMISIGLTTRARPIIEDFPKKQTPLGYFLSQEGEWDANGEALWAMWRYYSLTGSVPSKKIMKAVIKGAKWIINKRLVKEVDSRHAGLFPAGFSAEHFGPNDYYYWDDFWGVVGLRAAGELCLLTGKRKEANNYETVSAEFMRAIEMSLQKVSEQLQRQAIPASPYRRLDGGAIGSMVAGYPLQLLQGNDERLKETVDFLYKNCLVDGAFFHDLTHSGINAYLTLHIAQVMLRAKDTRFYSLVEAVARFASPTGQWPEAIHPITRGGCMGDGQHIWAAAEWLMMLRNMFVREEEKTLILCSGIPSIWWQKRETMSFGPTLTQYGNVSVRISFEEQTTITWSVEKRQLCRSIHILLPSQTITIDNNTQNSITITNKNTV